MAEKKEKAQPTSTTGKDFSKWVKDYGSEEAYCSFVDNQAGNHPVVKIHHGKWKELIDWEEGNQFALWNENKRSVIPVELTVRKKTVVINLMKPLNETIEGKLNFFHHIVGVPNSGEQEDIYGSQVATKLIDYNDYVNGMDELMEEMKYDLLRPGISCIKWVWDKDALGYVKNNEKGGPPVKENGEVIGEVVPIFNVRPDPTAKSRKRMRWLIELIPVTREEIKKKYKVSDDFIDTLVESKSDKWKGTHEKEREKDPDQEEFVIKEDWRIPDDLYPEGRLIISCAGKMLHAQENPSVDGEIPHFFFFYRKSGYSFWPKGPLHYIQDIQREFNRMISIISEHIEAWRPKMAVGKGALKRVNSMTVDAFELVEVDFARGEPRTLNMPELSGQVTAYRDFLISSIDKVSNIHEVSYARLPQYASRAPASLYSMMLEQESEKLHPMIKKINKTLVEMARFRLKLMDKHYGLKRMTKVIGRNKEATIQYFDKADLSESFDVRLEIGASLNQSTTIQQRLLIELWEKGILEGRDKIKIMKMLNLGTAEHELRSDMADTERAMRENQAFIDGTDNKKKEGGGVWVFMHDDHELHLDMHTNLAKSEEAAKLSKERWARLESHINEHFAWHLALKRGVAGAAAAPGGARRGVPGTQGIQPGGTPGRPTEGAEPMIEGMGGPQ